MTLWAGLGLSFGLGDAAIVRYRFGALGVFGQFDDVANGILTHLRKKHPEMICNRPINSTRHKCNKKLLNKVIFLSKSVPHGFFSVTLLVFRLGRRRPTRRSQLLLPSHASGGGRTHRNGQNNIIKYVLLQDLSGWGLGL